MSLRDVIDYIHELKAKLKRLEERISSLESQITHLSGELTRLSGSHNAFKKETHRSLKLLEDWVADLDRRILRLEHRAKRRLERREASDKPQ